MTASDARESALRQLPDGHSLALRLVDAGVAPDLICNYLHIEPEGLATMLEIARDKLTQALARRASIARHGVAADGARRGAPAPDGNADG